ncbi:MAG TPA: HlyD family secretion protein [Stellaceae bacterium]|nr:HlyD family secretion protein [Stellaceae bacterium]
MRKYLLVIVPVLAVLLALGGWRWWTDWRFMQSTDDAYVQADTIVIAPLIEGQLKEVRVADNQRVAEGQVLFVIDDQDYRTRVKQSEAVVETGEATLATFDSRLKMQQTMIEQAAAARDMAEADASRTQIDLKRYTALLSSSVASKQQYDTADADARKASAALVKSRAAFLAEQNQLGVLKSQKAEEAARLIQARAAVALAKSQLEDTVIRAPVAGVAGNRAGQIGQYVKPGMQLALLVPLPHVYVTANFKETQLTRMRPGQEATVEIDAYPDHPLTGQVESFAPASGAQFSLLPPDNATGNFTKIVQRVPVRIALPAEGPLAQLLRPGLSVTVTVDTRGEGSKTAEGGIVGTAEAAPAAAK